MQKTRRPILLVALLVVVGLLGAVQQVSAQSCTYQNPCEEVCAGGNQTVQVCDTCSLFVPAYVGGYGV